MDKPEFIGKIKKGLQEEKEDKIETIKAIKGVDEIQKITVKIENLFKIMIGLF